MNRIPRAVYTKALRDEAVKLALTGGVGVSEASRRLSIPIKTLASWVRAAKAGKLKVVGRHQKPLTEVKAELARIKRELAEVKMERDLLKKFAAGSTGHRNTFWSNVAPGGKVSEQEEAVWAIRRTKSVVVAEMERW